MNHRGTEDTKKNQVYRWSLLIILLGAVPRLWRLGEASLWLDELRTWHRARIPISHMLENLASIRNHVPFYFLSLHQWSVESELMLRLSSALAGILAVPLMMVMVYRITRDRQMALWAGVLLALNPYHVLLVRNARPYGYLSALTLAGSYCFIRLWQGDRRWMIWTGFLLTSLLAYLTHFLALVLPLAQLVVLITHVRRDWRFLLQWGLAQGIALIPLAGWAYCAQQQESLPPHDWVPETHWRDLLISIGNLATGYGGHMQGFVIPGLMVSAVGLSIGIGGVLWRYFQYHKMVAELYWLVSGAGMMGGLFTFSLLWKPQYMDRYLLVMQPGILLLVLYGWRRINQLSMAGLIISITSTLILIQLFRSGDYKREEWREAMGYIRQSFEPGDSIVSSAHPLTADYYDQPIGIVLPRRLQRDLVMDIPLQNPPERIWFIFDSQTEDIHFLGVTPDFNPLTERRTIVEAWIQENQQAVIEHRKSNGIDLVMVDLSDK